MFRALTNFWRSLFTSTETALLRAENKRLRETNFALEDLLEQREKELRAAINTTLAQAGIAPLPPHDELKAPVRKMSMRRLTWQQKQRMYAAATAPKEKEDGRSSGRTEPV